MSWIIHQSRNNIKKKTRLPIASCSFSKLTKLSKSCCVRVLYELNKTPLNMLQTFKPRGGGVWACVGMGTSSDRIRPDRATKITESSCRAKTHSIHHHGDTTQKTPIVQTEHHTKQKGMKKKIRQTSTAYIQAKKRTHGHDPYVYSVQ